MHRFRILRSNPDEWEGPSADNDVPHWVDTGFDRLHDIGLVTRRLHYKRLRPDFAEYNTSIQKTVQAASCSVS